MTADMLVSGTEAGGAALARFGGMPFTKTSLHMTNPAYLGKVKGNTEPPTLFSEVSSLDRLPQLLVLEMRKKNQDKLLERRTHAPSESN